jgi:hypothetical protein
VTDADGRRPWVLDHTAILALFDAYEPVMRMWHVADAGERQLMFPVCAVAEASYRPG